MLSCLDIGRLHQHYIWYCITGLDFFVVGGKNNKENIQVLCICVPKENGGRKKSFEK